MADDPSKLIGRCLMVGIRGATPDDPILRADLESCRAAHIRAVILFDVDLPTRAALEAGGMPRDEANRLATRNILNPAQLKDLCAQIKATLGPGTIVAIDQEGGRVARLKPERGFRASKSASVLGQLPSDERRAECDAEAAQLADMGIDLNFAPCVDLGDSADNPIITKLDRAFGADPAHIAECARDVIEAHTSHGIIACLKHFPGHGSATIDSHASLPDITESWVPKRDLLPYRTLLGSAQSGPIAVMTGHLFHGHLDPQYPASLSVAITNDLLRTQLGFSGVVVTDSLDMGAIATALPPEQAAIMAIEAGADIALHGFNAPGTPPDAPHPAGSMAEAMRSALDSGALDLEWVRQCAARIDALFSAPH